MIYVRSYHAAKIIGASIILQILTEKRGQESLIKQPSIQPLSFEFSREHLLLPLNPDRASGDPIRCLSAGVHADAALDNLSLFLDAPLALIPTPEPELRDALTRQATDLHLSTLLTTCGERVVIRLLEHTTKQPSNSVNRI